MAPHSSSVAWRTSWTEEPGRPQYRELQRVGHDWEAFTFTLYRTVKRKIRKEDMRGGKGNALLWGHYTVKKSILFQGRWDNLKMNISIFQFLGQPTTKIENNRYSQKKENFRDKMYS